MGIFSGWSAYRYGERETRRQPYLAGNKAKKRQTIIPAEQRRDLISATAEILETAELSKFEHEASCRHGIRTTLTLQGNAWAMSDAEAAAIVTAALDKVGAVRPQFLEGQPEFTFSQHQCQRCGAPLGDDAGHRRFCSHLCEESAKRYRNDFWARVQDIARAAAAYATAKANAAVRQCIVCGSPYRATTESTKTCSADCAARSRRTVHERPCAQCGTSFRPHSLTKAGKFCSPECAAEAQRKHFEQPCQHCHELFVPAKTGMRYCSTSCASAARLAIELPPRHCAFCGHEWIPKAPHAKFCSPQCKDNARNLEVKRRREAARAPPAAPPSPL